MKPSYRLLLPVGGAGLDSLSRLLDCVQDGVVVERAAVNFGRLVLKGDLVAVDAYNSN
jgi:hypothetical protein